MKVPLRLWRSCSSHTRPVQRRPARETLIWPLAASASYIYDTTEPLPQTREAAECAPALDSITLRFNVSRDEEYIEVVALHGARSFDLKARSHHYTLLILARARLRDQALPLDHQGWVHQNNLLAMLRVDASHLNLNIYRLRQQFEEAGIAAAAQIVERRVGTRRLRIGVSRIEICTLEHER